MSFSLSLVRVRFLFFDLCLRGVLSFDVASSENDEAVMDDNQDSDYDETCYYAFYRRVCRLQCRVDVLLWQHRRTVAAPVDHRVCLVLHKFGVIILDKVTGHEKSAGKKPDLNEYVEDVDIGVSEFPIRSHEPGTFAHSVAADEENLKYEEKNSSHDDKTTSSLNLNSTWHILQYLHNLGSALSDLSFTLQFPGDGLASVEVQLVLFLRLDSSRRRIREEVQGLCH